MTRLIARPSIMITSIVITLVMAMPVRGDNRPRPAVARYSLVVRHTDHRHGFFVNRCDVHTPDGSWEVIADQHPLPYDRGWMMEIRPTYYNYTWPREERWSNRWVYFDHYAQR
jgi:hypothetical protein